MKQGEEIAYPHQCDTKCKKPCRNVGRMQRVLKSVTVRIDAHNITGYNMNPEPKKKKPRKKRDGTEFKEKLKKNREELESLFENFDPIG